MRGAESVNAEYHPLPCSQTLSYQLQLAPKLDMQRQKWIRAIKTASDDYRFVAAAEVIRGFFDLAA